MNDIPRDQEGYPKDPLARTQEQRLEQMLGGMAMAPAPRTLRANIMAELRATPPGLMTRVRRGWNRMGAWRLPFQLAPVAALVIAAVMLKDTLTLQPEPQQPAQVRLDGAQLASAPEALDAIQPTSRAATPSAPGVLGEEPKVDSAIEIAEAVPESTVASRPRAGSDRSVLRGSEVAEPVEEEIPAVNEPVEIADSRTDGPVVNEITPATEAPIEVASAPLPVAPMTMAATPVPIAADNTEQVRIPFRTSTVERTRDGRISRTPEVHRIPFQAGRDLGDSTPPSLELEPSTQPSLAGAAARAPFRDAVAPEVGETGAAGVSRVPSLAERMAAPPETENLEDLQNARALLADAVRTDDAAPDWSEPVPAAPSAPAAAAPRGSAREAALEDFSEAPAPVSLAQAIAPVADEPEDSIRRVTPQQAESLRGDGAIVEAPTARTASEQMSFNSTDPRGLMDQIAELVGGYGGTVITRSPVTADEHIFRMTVNVPRYRIEGMERQIAILSDPAIAAAASALPAEDLTGQISPAEREFQRVTILIYLRNS